jgi:hypothetical protein
MRPAIHVLLLALTSACLPAGFDALAERPSSPAARLYNDQRRDCDRADGRSRRRGAVAALFSDGERALGWLGLDLDGRTTCFAHFGELPGRSHRSCRDHAALRPGWRSCRHRRRSRAWRRQGVPDRVVQFQVADFSRIVDAGLDMIVYPWVADPSPELLGPMASVQLDEGLPELLSVSEDGLFVWDSLGTSLAAYEDMRASMLADNPDAFAPDPAQGWGLTHCPGLQPTALAGGRVLPAGGRAALALSGDT